jgi:hypothetical protein
MDRINMDDDSRSGDIADGITSAFAIILRNLVADKLMSDADPLNALKTYAEKLLRTVDAPTALTNVGAEQQAERIRKATRQFLAVFLQVVTDEVTLRRRAANDVAPVAKQNMPTDRLP